MATPNKWSAPPGNTSQTKIASLCPPLYLSLHLVGVYIQYCKGSRIRNRRNRSRTGHFQNKDKLASIEPQHWHMHTHIHTHTQTHTHTHAPWHTHTHRDAHIHTQVLQLTASSVKIEIFVLAFSIVSLGVFWGSRQRGSPRLRLCLL